VTVRPKRKLIEVALPLEVINRASAHEKAVRIGQPGNIHVWWARRPLAACRAVLFASLVDDPSSDSQRFPTEKAIDDERDRLFGVLERLVNWTSGGDEGALEEARAEIRRSTGDNPPPVLDPFCGGGSIPLEAERLGLTAYASDLNPVAVLITKAVIEVPLPLMDLPPVHPDVHRGRLLEGNWKGAEGLAEDVRRYGAWMREEAERRVGHLYPDVRLPKEHGGGQARVVAWLWARTAHCPNPACGANTPLVRSFVLSAKKGRQTWIFPIVDHERRQVEFTVAATGPVPDGTVSRTGGKCLVCGSIIPLDYLRVQGSRGLLDRRLMAIAVEGPGGRSHVPARTEDQTVADAAEAEWSPKELMSTHSQYMGTPRYGLTTFSDLFLPRELVALDTLADLIRPVIERARADAHSAGFDPLLSSQYGDAIGIYLALSVSKLANRANAISTWMPSVECPGHIFTRQAIPMAWDFAEPNVFTGASGSFESMVDTTVGALRSLGSLPGRGTARIMDAREITDLPIRPMICTDPPYYDNVPFADLSDFFSCGYAGCWEPFCRICSGPCSFRRCRKSWRITFVTAGPIRPPEHSSAASPRRSPRCLEPPITATRRRSSTPFARGRPGRRLARCRVLRGTPC
jgi:putative DNA methylase